ncbi:hypothetical protein [Desulfocastanea catecholica]
MYLTRVPHAQVFDHYLTEEFLVNQMEQLESSGELDGSVEIYWLSMSRVMELALLCAGNYADSGQIRDSADLIVNPRHTEVHIDGTWEPVRVKRHERMTEQFTDYAPSGTNVGEWLRDNTHLVHVKGPLISDLYDMLKGADTLSESYLSSIDLRMQKISQTMTFIMQGQMMDPNYPLSGVIPEEKEFVEANLCRYNRKKFHQIGMHIGELLKDQNYCSSFLKREVISHRGNPARFYNSIPILRSTQNSHRLLPGVS